ncbi:hypothetical protein CP061683_1545B, partial [Chlamydia psittaci 06-1683]
LSLPCHAVTGWTCLAWPCLD